MRVSNKLNFKKSVAEVGNIKFKQLIGQATSEVVIG